MDTKQPEALRIADAIAIGRLSADDIEITCRELLRQHTEIETLRAGYSAARMEIASLRERVQQLGQLARDVNSRRVTELEAQLEAVGAGGVEPLRKRCLHQISEPAVAQAPVASIYVTNDGQREFDDWRVPLPVGRNELFAAPQPAAQAAPVDAAVQQDAERYRTLLNLSGARKRIWNHVLEDSIKALGDRIEDVLDAARAAQEGA